VAYLQQTLSKVNKY